MRIATDYNRSKTNRYCGTFSQIKGGIRRRQQRSLQLREERQEWEIMPSEIPQVSSPTGKQGKSTTGSLEGPQSRFKQLAFFRFHVTVTSFPTYNFGCFNSEISMLNVDRSICLLTTPKEYLKGNMKYSELIKKHTHNAKWNCGFKGL